MGSQIVAVRNLLISGVAAQSGMTGVETTFGYRVGSKARERVWTQNARFSHSSASMRAGKTFRDEDGTFDVVILIEGIGKDPYWVASRAVTIGLIVEDWVATHSNWQGAINGLSVLVVEGDGALVEAFNDKGSMAELTYPIRYNARLT